MRRGAILVRAGNDDPARADSLDRGELEAMDPTLPGVFAVYTDIVASVAGAGAARHASLVVFGVVVATLAAVGTSV